MVALPAATPVTRPVEALTDATNESLVDHEPPVTVEVKDDVPLMQMFCVPEIDPAVGGVLTDKLRVMTESQSLVAVIVRL